MSKAITISFPDELSKQIEKSSSKESFGAKVKDLVKAGLKWEEQKQKRS